MKTDASHQQQSEIDRLADMSNEAIYRLHVSLFESVPYAGNPQLARRRIAFHLQAESEGGGLPRTVRQHAIAIANDLTHRARLIDNLSRRSEGLPCAGEVTATVVSKHDSRIPLPGSVLVKEYRGRRILAHALDSGGFEWEGQRFASLTALARAISGTHWNGFEFFNLTK